MRSITGIFEELWFNFTLIYIIVSMSYKRTPRLWNTFEFASITLHTKRVVKINFDVPIYYAAKLKKQKARNWGNTNIFLNKILDNQ